MFDTICVWEEFARSVKKTSLCWNFQRTGKIEVAILCTDQSVKSATLMIKSGGMQKTEKLQAGRKLRKSFVEIPTKSIGLVR